MPLYTIYGITPEGRESQMELQAADEAAAKTIAKDRNFFPTKAVRSTGRFSDPAKIRLSRTELSELLTHLELQTAANIQIVAAIGVLKDRLTAKRTRILLREVHDFLVSSRGNLTEALAQHPRTFPKDVLAVIAAGERTATLESSFRELRERTDFVTEIRRTVRNALQYPAIVSCLGLAMITFFMSNTVPKITEVLHELNAEIPALTALVIRISDLFVDFWPVVLAGTAATFAIVTFLRKSPRFAPRFDAVILRAPLYGNILFHLSASLFCRVYRSLYLSKEDPLNALSLCSDLIANHAIKQRLRSATRFISDGDTLGAAFQHAKALPPEACAIISSGEASGSLEDALLRVSTFYARLAKDKIQILSGWLGPAVMIGGGLFFGVVLVAMFLPIANLATQIK